MVVGKMVEPHKNMRTCLIDCACDLLHMIVNRGFFAAYPIQWYLREQSNPKIRASTKGACSKPSPK